MVSGCLLYIILQGQEATTLEYDDEVKITPFNMKEELEEDGHFDSAGTFIFKKVSRKIMINGYCYYSKLMLVIIG